MDCYGVIVWYCVVVLYGVLCDIKFCYFLLSEAKESAKTKTTSNEGSGEKVTEAQSDDAGPSQGKVTNVLII